MYNENDLPYLVSVALYVAEVVVCTSIVPGNTASRVWYVQRDSSILPSVCGAMDKPCSTIWAALVQSSDGDTVMVTGGHGVYDEECLNPPFIMNHSITIQSNGSPKPEIVCPDVLYPTWITVKHTASLGFLNLTNLNLSIITDHSLYRFMHILTNADTFITGCHLNTVVLRPLHTRGKPYRSQFNSYIEFYI